MLQKTTPNCNRFAGTFRFFSQVILMLLLPVVVFASDSFSKDSIEQIKSESYKLLGEKNYEGFLRKIDQGKKYALIQEDSASYIEFLTFEGEYYYMREGRGKVIPIFRKILSIVDEEHDEYVNICNHLAHAYNDIPNVDSAMFFINKALDSKYSTGLEQLLNYKTKGDIYQSSGDYPSAIHWILKGINGVDSLELKNENDHFQKDNFLTNSYGELGDLFMLIGDMDAAKTYVHRAVLLGEKLGLRKTFIRTVNHLGDILLAQNQIDSALYYYQMAYAKLDVASASDLELFKYYRNMFLGNLRKGDLSEAENYKDKFKEYFNLLDHGYARDTYFIILAEYFLEKQNYSKCLEFLRNFNQETDSDTNIQYYRLKHLAYEKSGQINLAYQAQNEYYHLKDSLINVQNNHMIYNLEGKYHKAEQDLAIAKLDISNKEKTILLSKKNRTILFGGIGLLTLAILGALGFNLYRTKQKSSAELAAKNKIISKALSEKELLLKEIHHRVKNNLQVISSLLSLQSDYIEDDTALSAIQEGRDRVKSMAIIHQNLYQEENLTGIQVKDYFEKLTKSLFSSYNIRPGVIDLTLDIDAINLDVDTVIPIGLIVNELITNALKYAFPENQKGSIHIGLKEKNDQLILTVKDDGIGFDSKSIGEESNSFGYKIIQAFKDKLDADLKIESDNGTTVFFTIGEYKLAG